MQLRKSTAIKFFAILLFLLESIAPAFVAEQSTKLDLANSPHFQTYHGSSLVISFFAEESDGEERDELLSKGSQHLADYLFISTFTKLADEKPLKAIALSHNRCLSSAPPLFQLHSVYLI